MKKLIVLQSDFGIDSGLVASMHGVCKSVDMNLEIHDLTHLIPPFSIASASEFLHYTILCWPKETVFVSVVDPGVGTDRKPHGNQFSFSPCLKRRKSDTLKV